MGRPAAVVASLTYGIIAFFVYAGFLFPRPNGVQTPVFSLRHLTFLAFLIPVLALPLFCPYAIRKIGAKRLVFSLIPTLAALIAFYLASAAHYYQTQTHLFDPFLQAPPPRLHEQRESASASGYLIVAMGGSTTRNGHLPPDSRHPFLLRSFLRARYPGLEVEVFNSGMEWWTTKHSLIHYVTSIRELRPDLVIVMHAVNDLYRSFSPPAYATREYKPSWSHFYGPAMAGARPPSYPGHLYQRYLSRVARKWYARQRYVEADYPVERYVSIGSFEENLRKLVHYVRSDGVEVILLTQPSLFKEKMTEDEKRALISGFTFCLGRRSWWQSEYPSPLSLYWAMEEFNAVIRRVSDEGRVPLVDLAAVVPKTLRYFVDDVHYTAEGSGLVARVVGEAIEDLGLLDDGGRVRRGDP